MIKVNLKQKMDKTMEGFDTALSPELIWAQTNYGDLGCPWVKIGNLYTSVTITGSTSWDHVVRSLADKGQKDFVIMTGRHGDQLGQRIDARGYFEPRLQSDPAVDPKGDEETANLIRTTYKDINIEVKDVGNGTCNTTGLLQVAISEHLSQERVVILAWCYSLYAMKLGWGANPFLSHDEEKEEYTPKTVAANQVPICETAKDWTWALGDFVENPDTDPSAPPNPFDDYHAAPPENPFDDYYAVRPATPSSPTPSSADTSSSI